jgi:glycosyltransferase involved in cell wall biosynthesis
MRPYVSVVIPAYNRPDDLRRAVSSVLAQTFRDFEIIVVDDLSREPIAAALEDFRDERLSVVRHKVNLGDGGARNTGVANAQGDWIAFLDDDDTWVPEKLERQLRFMQTCAPEADASGTDFICPDGSVHRISEIARKNGIDYVVLHWEGLVPSTWLVKREVFEKVGYFDTNFRRAVDWEWILRFYQKGLKLVVVPEALMIYAGWHCANPRDAAAYVKRVGDKHRDALRRIASPVHLVYFEVFQTREFARVALGAGRRGEAATHLLRMSGHLARAMKLDPMMTMRYAVEAVASKAGSNLRKGASVKRNISKVNKGRGELNEQGKNTINANTRFVSHVDQKSGLADVAGMAKMGPTVSVVLPTFNRPNDLRQAVVSVLAQTYRDFEFIVVDDCSREPIAGVLADLEDPRLIILRHDANKGEGGARNTGIAKSRGEWIAFLDDDDTWLPEKLERQLQYITFRAPGADAVATDFLVTGKGVCNISDVLSKRSVDFILLHWEGLLPSTWMVRREVFNKVGGFDTSLRRAADWEWLLRFYLKGLKLAIVPEALTQYSGWHSSNLMEDVACVKRVADMHRDALRKIAPPLDFEFFEIYQSREFAREALGSGRLGEAVFHRLQLAKHLTRAMSLAPISTIDYAANGIAKKARSGFRKLWAGVVTLNPS